MGEGCEQSEQAHADKQKQDCKIGSGFRSQRHLTLDVRQSGNTFYAPFDCKEYQEEMKISDYAGVVQAIIAGIALLFAVITTSFVEKTFYRGSAPQKSLVYTNFGASDALDQLRNAGGIVSVDIKSEGRPIENLFVLNSSLKNDGMAPILPEDIFDNITVNVDAPWDIISVSNKAVGGQTIAFEWEKISNRVYRAKKALINPGDIDVLTIYLTRTDQVVGGDASPKVSWSARITNLPEIKQASVDKVTLNTSILPIYVYMNGNGVLFVVFSFSFYLFSYYYLLQALNIRMSPNAKSVAAHVFLAVLSLLGAEAGNAYVFGSTILPSLFPVEHKINLPCILANWCVLAILIVASLRRKARGRSEGFV